MTKERIDRIREFLASGASICPFAKSYLDGIGFASVPENYRPNDVKYPVIDLVKSPGLMAATYVFDTNMPIHEEERVRGARLFKDLFKILLLEEHGEIVRKSFAELERDLDIALAPDSSINPFLHYKDQPFFSIAMNPLYQETHPRWSPCPMMVITRHDDVATVDRKAKDVIRRLMKERTGRVYDADELYLMPDFSP